MNRSALMARVTSLDCFEVEEVPRGEYWRDAEYGSLEGNVAIELRRNPCRERVEELLDGLVGKDFCAVVDHLGGPLERRVFRHRLGEEQGPTESQRLPSLRQGAARFPRLNDARGVRDEGHRPIPAREVLPLDRGADRVLRDREMVSHDLLLEGRVLPRVDLVEGCAEDGDGPSAVLDGRGMSRRVDAL